MSESTLEQVSATDDAGRVLTGVGTTTAALEKTMERHAPDVPAASEPASQQPSEPRQSRGQKRFDQLTKERETYREQAEAAARERDDLRTKLEAASRTPAPPATMPVEQPPPPAASTQTRSKPNENEVGSKYETYADFIEDLADWKAEQRLSAQDFDAQIRRSIEADRASRSRDERSIQSVTRGRARYADFDAVLKGATHFQSTDWPNWQGEAINELPEPEHIYYQLAKDRALAERLKGLNPVQYGIELAKLIPASSVAVPASTQSAGTVTPPVPYQPVGAGSKTTAPPLADLPKKAQFDFDASGYRERRAAERGVTRRR